MSEAVTVPSLMMMTLRDFEESLQGTDRQRETDGLDTHTHDNVCVQLCSKSQVFEKPKEEDGKEVS